MGHAAIARRSERPRVTDDGPVPPAAVDPDSAPPEASPPAPAIADDGAGYHVRIRDLPSEERPRERLLHAGAGALSNAELLAILLRTGTAGESALDIGHRLLATHGLDGLQRLDADLLAREHGLGPASAAQIKASLELGRRLATLQPEQRPRISSPEDVAAIVGTEMAALEQEELRVFLLNTKNEVQSVRTVYRGSVNSTQVRIGEILRDAVRRNTPALIAVHNHPSGDPTPSRDDIAMTKELIAGGKLLDIDVLDHIVIGSGGRVVSLRGEGLIG